MGKEKHRWATDSSVTYPVRLSINFFYCSKITERATEQLACCFWQPISILFCVNGFQLLWYSICSHYVFKFCSSHFLPLFHGQSCPYKVFSIPVRFFLLLSVFFKSSLSCLFRKTTTKMLWHFLKISWQKILQTNRNYTANLTVTLKCC